MTDLNSKFVALEDLLSTNNTAVTTALDAILEALGAPPVSPGVTLANVVTALNAMTTAQAAQHLELMDVLGLINTSTDTIINNNSLNAQRTIAAILATFCPCTTGVPLLAPVIDVTPTSLADQAKCRRIQFYLSVFSNWMGKIANYGGAGAFITGDVVGTLLGLAAAEAGIVATGVEVGTVLGPPGMVLGAVIGLIGGAIGIFGASVLGDYVTQYNAPAVQSALLAALYAATTADEGQTAFQSVIGANFSAIPAGIINALWWSAWSNDLYSGVPTVDDSAFDGTICAPPADVFPPTTGCITMTSETCAVSNGSPLQAIVWPGGGSIVPASASGAGSDLTSDKNMFGHISIAGLWVSSVVGCTIYWNANGYPNFSIGSFPIQLPLTGGDYYTFLRGDSTVFQITLCAEQP